MNRQFPDVIVLVKNENPWDFAHPYAGEMMEFPSGKGIKVSPECAHTLFAWDTRSGQLTRDDKPNPLDRGNSYFDVCNLRYGWANDPEKKKWLYNFKATIVPIEAQVSGEVFDKLAVEQTKRRREALAHGSTV